METIFEHYEITFNNQPFYVADENFSRRSEYVILPKDTISAVHKNKVVKLWVKPIFT